MSENNLSKNNKQMNETQRNQNKMITKLTKLSIATLIALGTSSAAMADDNRYIIKIEAGQESTVKALAAQMGGNIKVDAKGFIAVSFDNKSFIQSKKDLSSVLKSPYVQSIEADPRRYLNAAYNDDVGDPSVTQLTPYAVYQSQANQLDVDSSNYKKVCVIDSGLAGKQGETGDLNTDFDWTVITGSDDTGTGEWDTDGGPHGTHVAGTVAAADNDYGVVGMAPGNPMHIVKVFNASGWGYSSDLAYAAQKCTEGGADIITMSLGGGGANSTEENAFNDFTAAGGLVLAAAGNDGNTTRSYPAGYKSIMMIGANDADNNIASFSQFPSCELDGTTDDGLCVEVTAGGVNTLSTYPAGGATLAGLTADGTGYAASAMENRGSVNGSTYFMGTAEAVDTGAAGKVCTIDRGNISFYDKVANCEASGGIGAIIINNVSGLLRGTLGGANDTTIPVVGTTLEDRDALLAATNIAVSIEGIDYGYMSGTSMATPAVAGVAALVWSNNPSCTGTEIREALKASADDAGAAGKDDYFGYGIVKAADADAYIKANGCDGDSVATPIKLSVKAFVNNKDRKRVKLKWSGNQTNVDIYRNGDAIATDISGRKYKDKLKKQDTGTFTYEVCNTGTSNCSLSISVNF